MAGGANCCWKGLQKEAIRWGQEGWGKGCAIRGVGQGEKGGGIYIKIKFSTKQVSLHWFWLSECTLRDEIGQNRRESLILGGIPIVMTSRSQKDVIISPKKVQKWEGERFHLIIYARRSNHLGKLKNCLTSKFKMLFVTKLVEDLTWYSK